MYHPDPGKPDIAEPVSRKPHRPVHPILSIRGKLLGLVFFLLLILISSGYFLGNSLHGSLHIIQQQTASIQALQETTTAEKIYTSLRWTYLNYLGNATDSNLTSVQDKLNKFRTSLEPLKKGAPGGDIDAIEDLITGLENTADNLKTIHPDSEQAVPLQTEATRKLGQIDEILNTMANHLEDTLSQTAVQTRKQTGTLRTIPIVFIIGGLLTILFAAAVATLQLFMPIGRITKAMTAASIDTANARDYILPIPRHDEIGLATGALNSLLLEVSEGIERISTTERKLRETGQYLQAIMDNVVDGVITMDDSGRIETFSPSAEKLFQRPAKDVLGTHIGALLFDNKGAAFDLVTQIAHNPSDFYNLSPSELQALTKSGTMVPVELAVGQAGFAGRTIFVATLRNISIRKQMEAFLEQAQRMETVGRMTGGIAHDFNNMLTVISGNFELIGMKMKGEEPLLKSMIAMGLETVRKGKEMTQRLLAISSKQLLKPEVLDLHERLPSVVEMIRRAVREDVEIKTTIPENGLWNIRVDPVQFESALLNLAINARDALPDHCGRISLEASNVNLSEEASFGISNVRPGAYVMVTISDNGHGIPANILDRVFEPFFTTKDGTKGTGLGLSMVYGFTRQSGGYVVISSSTDKGTSAKLLFPRSVEQHAIGGNEKTVLDQKAEDIPTGTESLLVVEDRLDVLQYLTQTLRELGYRVTYASDALSALKKLEKRKNLDMLLTDVVMPGDMNGEMLAQEALKRLPNLKVLYISGYTRDALVEQGALKRGVNLLSKPFTRADLAWHVRKVLDAA